MTNREILQHIDDGANYYVSLFAEAIHMEKVDNEFYSCIKPKVGEQGISFIYHVHLNDLPPEQIKEVVDEMKSMNVPIWLGLLASDEVSFIFSGKEPAQGQNEPVENDEVYMAMLPEDQKKCYEENHKIVRIHSAEEFAQWAQITNGIFFGGHPIVHPVHHYIWCEKIGVKCYFLYHDSIPVSVAAIMEHHGAASLEFVGTIPEMRKKGFAAAICAKATRDAFSDGASIVTLRSADAAAAKIYQSIGFKAYS